MSVEPALKHCSVLSGGVGFIWKRVRRVGDCRSSSQGGGDHRGLDHPCVGGTCLARVTAVDIDVIRELSGERNSDGNQFLVLRGNCSIGDGCPLSNAQNAVITAGGRLF